MYDMISYQIINKRGLMNLIKPSLQNFITESLAIEAESAIEAGKLGYMARSLVQATMPHKNPGDVNVWARRNGNFQMIMQPGMLVDKDNHPISIGLPYGTKPRLIMAYICSEAVKKRSREIILGRSLSEFMSQLDLQPTGGRWGTIPMLKEQMRRLFTATVSFQMEGEGVEAFGGFKIASHAMLFWNPTNPEQTGLWESTVTLTSDFFDEITQNAVPIDMRALSLLKGSSMALDIYCWLTYRMSYLKGYTEIPWELLATQFGAEYETVRDFKKNFKKQLLKVLTVYDAKVSDGERGLILKPSKTHIPKISG